jgi:hypothetical protein
VAACTEPLTRGAGSCQLPARCEQNPALTDKSVPACFVQQTHRTDGFHAIVEWTTGRRPRRVHTRHRSLTAPRMSKPAHAEPSQHVVPRCRTGLCSHRPHGRAVTRCRTMQQDIAPPSRPPIHRVWVRGKECVCSYVRNALWMRACARRRCFSLAPTAAKPDQDQPNPLLTHPRAPGPVLGDSGEKTGQPRAFTACGSRLACLFAVWVSIARVSCPAYAHSERRPTPLSCRRVHEEDPGESTHSGALLARHHHGIKPPPVFRLQVPTCSFVRNARPTLV